MKEYKVSWRKYNKLIEKLVKQIPKDHYKQILAIGRGGFVPGVHLSHLLKIPMDTVSVSLYDKDRVLGEVVKFHPPFPEKLVFPLLIVDDIWDSGKTITTIRSRVLEYQSLSPTVDVAVLVRKLSIPFYSGERFILYVPFFGTIKQLYYVDIDTWVVFPWER